MVLKIADRQKPDEIISYEINASVMGEGGEHENHGFFAHHFGGGSWGWWGTGLMIVIMAPMMLLLL